MMPASGWMTADQAVRWITFRNDGTYPPEAAPQWWWDRWGSLPSLCGTKHEMLSGLKRIAAGDAFERPPELKARISRLISSSGKSAGDLTAEIAADLAIYMTARRQEVEAETELKNAAARGDIEIFGHPVDPADLFQQNAVAGSRMAPIAAEIFAEDGGGFRSLGEETYGAQLLPGGFDRVWTGGSWTRLKVRSDVVMRLWPAVITPKLTTHAQPCARARLNAATLRYVQQHQDDQFPATRPDRQAGLIDEDPTLAGVSDSEWLASWDLAGAPAHWRKSGRRPGKCGKHRHPTKLPRR